MSLETQQQLESQYLINSYARKPVDFVRGEGMCLFDDTGKKYLDFLSGIAVCALGHCHPALVSALTKQTETLMHVSNYYYIEGRGELAQKLSSMLTEYAGESSENWRTFFTNSGAESNECAIKLARLWSKEKGTGGQEIICMSRSFHGRTLATLAATMQPVKQSAFAPLPSGFIEVAPNDIDALEDLLFRHRNKVAAIMLEPVQGESGVHPLHDDYLRKVIQQAHAHNVLVIADEVQCGIYRCGTPFAFQQSGIVPDIVTMAKGIGGGFPMGACSAKDSVASVFEPGLHGSTFGGGPLAIAAANAVIDTIQEQDLGLQVTKVGLYLHRQLEKIPQVKVVRGKGLMIGCDLRDGIDAPTVVAKALEAGVVLNYTGPSTLRLVPPLVCTEADVDAMIAVLKEVLA